MKRIIGAAAILAAAALVAGCGGLQEANDHKARDPAVTVNPSWVRIATPSNYPTVVHGCYKHNGHWMGIWLNQDASNTTTVVKDDPTCPITTGGTP